MKKHFFKLLFALAPFIFLEAQETNTATQNNTSVGSAAANHLNVSAAGIAKRYIGAIGGRAALEKIHSIAFDGVATYQGIVITLEVIKTDTGQSYTNISVNGKSRQKSVFNGEDGYLMTKGKKMEMPAETKEQLKKSKSLFPELEFESNPNIKYVGVEYINGENSYKVQDDNVLYYYSITTGLKMGETRTEKINGQDSTIPITYSDYRPVNGVQLPFILNQVAIDITMTYNVKSYLFNTATEENFRVDPKK